MSREQAQAIEKLLREAPLDVGGNLGIQRPLFEELLAGHPLPAGVTVTPGRVGGVGVVYVRPSGASTQTSLLFFHGGAYALGSAASSVGLVADLAERATVSAVTVDYRLAPENPYPAAVDDALAAYRALLDDEGLDAGGIVVVGESAGGGLALAALVAARESGLPQPAGCLLFSPWVDLTLSGPSAVSKAHTDPALTRHGLAVRARDYIADADPAAAKISPLFANLSGLPPLLIQVGSHEILLDDALSLAGVAAHADVAVTLEVTPFVPHVFQGFAAVLTEASSALDRAAAFTRARLAGCIDSSQASGVTQGRDPQHAIGQSESGA